MWNRAWRYLFLLYALETRSHAWVWIIGICQMKIIIVIVTLPFGLEQLGLETCRRAHVESLTAERLMAERKRRGQLLNSQYFAIERH